MPFNILMTYCLIDKTSWNDSPKSPEISIEPKSGEKILFFPIDTDRKDDRNYKFRDHYELVNKPICDLIIYYADFSRGINRLIFTEAKGRKIEDAKEQLTNTYNAVLEHDDFKKFKANNCHNEIDIWLLCVSNSANETLPNSKKKKEKKEKCEMISGAKLYEVRPNKFADKIRG